MCLVCVLRDAGGKKEGKRDLRQTAKTGVAGLKNGQNLRGTGLNLCLINSELFVYEHSNHYKLLVLGREKLHMIIIDFRSKAPQKKMEKKSRTTWLKCPPQVLLFPRYK